MVDMKEERQNHRLRMAVPVVVALLLCCALFSSCSPVIEQPLVPWALNYMPVWFLETQLSTYFPVGMSKTDVKETIEDLDGWFSSYGYYERGVYVDNDGNASLTVDHVENVIGTSSYMATFNDAPAVVCFVYFALDENGELIGIYFERAWTMY